MRTDVISDLEIVGISSSTNGRSCINHDVCGEHLQEGDVCRLILVTVLIQNMEEEAIKVVKVEGGNDTPVPTLQQLIHHHLLLQYYQ